MAGDDPAVGFTEVVQVRPPRLDIGPGGHRQGDRVKTGQRGRPHRIVPNGQPNGPARIAQRQTHHHPVFDELQRDLETEDPPVPVAAAGDVGTGSFTWWNPEITPITRHLSL